MTGLRIAVRAAQLAVATLVGAAVFGAGLLRGPERGRARVARAAGAALRGLCQHLGATFIKVGQIASTRGDLLPPGVVGELAKLRDQVPAFDFASVRETVEADFGRPLGEMFSSFEATPIAAASVAQVHRATLPGDGTPVAVKVRRPDIAGRVALDRAILSFVARAGERLVPSLRIVALEGAVASFCDAVEEQLDLAREADNNRRFQHAFRDDPDVCFPELHDELCSARVLTMELIGGVHESDLDQPGSGIDVHAVVEAGMRGVSRMIFSHGFVHADLHPGNMRFVPPGRVVLLDLGLVGRLEDRDRLNTARMLYAFATGDGATVARVLYDEAPHTATPDYGAYEAEVEGFVGALVDRGLASVQITLEIGRLFDILRRHHVQARSHMTMVNLALMTAEGLGKRLAPDLSLTEAALPYLAEALGIAHPAAPEPTEASRPAAAAGRVAPVAPSGS